MSDPVIKQDDEDPKRIDVLRGRTGTITYKVRGRRGSKTVRRSQAEFAELTRADGYSIKEITLADADRFVSEAIATANERDAEVERFRASVDLTCRHCRQTLSYRGRVTFLAGEPGPFTDLDGLNVEKLRLHAYACRSCGATTLFEDGHLRHPLPGAQR